MNSTDFIPSNNFIFFFCLFSRFSLPYTTKTYLHIHTFVMKLSTTTALAVLATATALPRTTTTTESQFASKALTKRRTRHSISSTH